MIFFKMLNATYLERQYIKMSLAANFIANLMNPYQESKIKAPNLYRASAPIMYL